MDPSACKVIYIDDRFNVERWITRDGLPTATSPKSGPQADFSDLPPDLQSNVNAFLSVFNQVFVCHSGRLFSTKLSELHDSVKIDCTPIIACFDVGSESRQNQSFRSKPRFSPSTDSPLPSPTALRREYTFSSESDESYGIQLLSRIASDLQVEEDSKLIIPVAIVRPKRKDSYDMNLEQVGAVGIARSPYGSETRPVRVVDTSDAIDPQVMLSCLDAGALDVVKSPLDKAGIMGLTVHAYRRHKMAKKEQASFMAAARRARKQSWVGVEEKEQPYAYLREAMVRKLLRGICEPETTIESYQQRDLCVADDRKLIVARAVGTWNFDGSLFDEEELVYAGYCILDHALQLPELENWRMSEDQLLHFMQGCRVAYNHFVLYHNFRHAVDVLQSLFYFLVQIGTLPPYPVGGESPPLSMQKSPIAKLLGSFEALTLLISAIGHDVGHPGVNNMFLVKLNAPLAQLYNDQSVLEAFHCAAFSQILRRHWPAAFHDKRLRKLMISSILATDMGVHADYMQQLGHLQERIHQSKATDGWAPKDIDAFRVLTCGLLIKCADISNVARPWAVAERWTHLLQKEFANQGDMEKAVGMETTLFGGPPELGNMLKLANGQIGFMTIFAHPLFANVSDVIPAMGFAADEILTNKGVWFTRAEHEKRKETLRQESAEAGGGSVSPRSQSPVGLKGANSHVKSPLRQAEHADENKGSRRSSGVTNRAMEAGGAKDNSSLAVVAGLPTPEGAGTPRSNPSSEKGLRATGPTQLVEKIASSSDPQLRDKTNSQRSNRLDGAEGRLGTAMSSSTGLGIDSISATDDRRDTAVSMRAGSEQVPVLDHELQPSKERSPSPLAKFNFATSREDEPVRTYDPEQHYPPIHTGARASVPVNDAGHVSAMAQATQSTSKSSMEEATSATTQSTRFTGDDSERAPTSTGESKSDFEKRRARAASAPTSQPNMSPLSGQQSQPGTASQKSFRSGLGFGSSRDSSKQDIRTTIMNGELFEPSTGSSGDRDEGSSSLKDRMGSTAMRRRSRIRLAFWKRKRSDSGGVGNATGGGDDESMQS